MRLKQILLLTALLLSCRTHAQKQDRPNVIFILTDDQGWGDLAFHENPHINTPAIDQIAKRSVRLTNYFVSPVCAPTRASLMTGRYSLRTGVRDTYNGGAIMSSDEITLAEILGDAGYKTAIFGKWHLGDNYPARPEDQGFQESLVHLAGGIGQPGDYLNFHKGDSSYFNPTLLHNGVPEQTQGYCSDVYTDAAIHYIESQKDHPFFIYLSFNAPHAPLQLPQEYYDIYKEIDPSEGFPALMQPAMSEKDKEDARKVYGMVHNIDDNIERLMSVLKELHLDKRTLVVFSTDNGPAQRRYLGGMRGKKGTVYQGGIKVPCFFHFPAKFPSGKELDFPAMHIDIMPTIASLCGARLPSDRKIDGIDLLPHLLSKNQLEAPPERSLFFYWHRRSIEKYHNIAIRQGDYKLVGNSEYNAPVHEFELFRIDRDFNEQQNLVIDQPQKAAQMKTELDHWYDEMIQEPNMLNFSRAIVGTAFENPVVLNRNDAFGPEAIWKSDEIFAYWEIKVAEAGYYNLKFKFSAPLAKGGIMKIQLGPVHYTLKNEIAGQQELEMKELFLPAIEGQFMPWYRYRSAGAVHNTLPFTIEIRRTNLI
jgi:arylsulfatase A-like enzyme